MESLWLTAAVWAVLALVAGMTAKRTGVSVALVEIVVGIIAGNFLGVAPTSKAEWVTFLAGFGSILLTFMAGAEIEPGVLRKYLKESLLIWNALNLTHYSYVVRTRAPLFRLGFAVGDRVAGSDCARPCAGDAHAHPAW